MNFSRLLPCLSSIIIMFYTMEARDDRHRTAMKPTEKKEAEEDHVKHGERMWKRSEKVTAQSK